MHPLILTAQPPFPQFRYMNAWIQGEDMDQERKTEKRKEKESKDNKELAILGYPNLNSLCELRMGRAL